MRGAYGIAALGTVLAAASGLWLRQHPGLGGLLAGIDYAVLPHIALLLWMLAREARRDRGCARIDGLMAAALSYVLWFVLVPLWHLV